MGGCSCLEHREQRTPSPREGSVRTYLPATRIARPPDVCQGGVEARALVAKLADGACPPGCPTVQHRAPRIHDAQT